MTHEDYLVDQHVIRYSAGARNQLQGTQFSPEGKNAGLPSETLADFRSTEAPLLCVFMGMANFFFRTNETVGVEGGIPIGAVKDIE